MSKYSEKKLSVNSVKHRHKELVLKALIAEKAITRTQIAKELSISNATVGTIIEELLSDNLVSETKDTTVSVGRRPSILKIEANNVLTMLIDLCSDKALSYTLMNLKGEMLFTDTLKIINSYNDTMKNLLESAQSKLKSKKTLPLLKGICVCISGIYDINNDTVSSSNIPELCNVEVSKTIKNYFDVDVFVDNDINLITRSYLATENPNSSNLLFIYIGAGVGSSMIIDGKLYEGNCGFAGEIGQTLVCENMTLEQKASAEKLFNNVAQKYNVDYTAATKITAEKYNNEDTYILNQLEDIIDALSFCIVNMIWTINPEIIYISGELNILGDKFIGELCQKVYSRTSPLLEKNTSIEPSSPGKI